MGPLVPFPDALRQAPLGRLISIAGRMAEQRWSRYLAEHHGLSAAGMRVLLILGRTGDSTHRDVAERTFVRPATLTGIIDTLERDGFVERHRDATDRRTVLLALTDKGREHSRKLIDLIHSDRPLTSIDADPAKREIIRDFLTELITTMSDQDVGRLNPGEEDTDETRRGLRPC